MKQRLVAFLMVFSYLLVSEITWSQDIVFMVYKREEGKNNRVSREDLQHMIAGMTDVRVAGLKIRQYFRPNFERFMLYCEKCPTPRTYCYPAPVVPSPSKTGGLTTWSLGTISRGVDEDIYTMPQLLGLIKDTVALLDSTSFSLDKMADRDDAVLSSFIIKYAYKGHAITRPIPFDTEKKTLTFSYRNFFGVHLSPDVTDSIPVKVYYMTRQGEERLVTDRLSYHFMTAKEQESILQLYLLYRSAFAVWNDVMITDEMLPLLRERYKIVEKENLVKWLQMHKPAGQ